MLTDTSRRLNEVKFRLSGYPDLIQINDASVAVTARGGKSQRFYWSGKNCEYRLTVLAPSREGSPSWQLDTIQNGQSRPIWVHTSCDVPLIHNLIVSACGDASKTVETDGLMASSAAYRQVSKKHELYFAKNEPEYQPAAADTAVTALKGIFNSVNALPPVNQAPPAEKTNQEAAIENFRKEIENKETGLYNASAMLFFLEQEYFRSYRGRAPMSFMLLRARTITSGGITSKTSLSATQIRDIAGVIDKLRRTTDLIGHYHGDDIAILLPNTNSRGADQFARKVLKELEKCLSMASRPNVVSNRVSYCFGIASIPDDAIDLTRLTILAESTVNSAYQRCCSIVGHADHRAIPADMITR